MVSGNIMNDAISPTMISPVRAVQNRPQNTSLPTLMRRNSTTIMPARA